MFINKIKKKRVISVLVTCLSISCKGQIHQVIDMNLNTEVQSWAHPKYNVQSFDACKMQDGHYRYKRKYSN